MEHLKKRRKIRICRSSCDQAVHHFFQTDVQRERERMRERGGGERGEREGGRERGEREREWGREREGRERGREREGRERGERGGKRGGGGERREGGREGSLQRSTYPVAGLTECNCDVGHNWFIIVKFQWLRPSLNKYFMTIHWL